MNSEGKKPIRRRRYFIKKSFQARFFIGFVSLLVVQVLLIAALFMYMSSQTLTTGYAGSRFVIDRTSDFFFIGFVIISLIAIISVGLTGIITFILLSHRIAGPLYRFEDTLRNISSGNLSGRVNLRKTDQLADLQNTFNAALNKIDNQLSQVKNDLKEAHNLTLQYDKEEHMQEVRDAIARAKQKTNFFKTS